MAEPAEYTVESFQPWIDRETGNAVKDPHGNIKGSVLFVEDKAEPIDATFKAMPNPGDKKYGVVDLYQTRAGSMRKGFKSAPRPNPAYGNAPAQAEQAGVWKYPRNDEHTQESIARSVALKAAVDTFNETVPTEVILKTADIFLVWLQGNPATPHSAQAASGYDKARAVAQTLRRDERDEDNDIRSMMDSQPNDLNDAPY